MSRHLLIIAILFGGQFAFGQSSIYGKYRGTGILFDSLRITYQLRLKEDGSYTMQYSRKDSLMAETGKWRHKGGKVKLKPKYSKAEKQYALQRTFVLDIEGDRLIWKKSNPELERDTKKFEKEMSKTVGENVTLVAKSEPLILYKELAV
jgi:hypothetical protein